MVDHLSRTKLVLALSAVIAAAAGGVANAQSMNTNSASYNAGYGRTTDQENQPVDVQMRDASGNLVVVDGVIQTGEDQSVFASAGATAGALDAVSGVGGQGSSSAVGNSLSVVTQGNNNTVIVNSVQNNSGNVNATTSLSGGVTNAQ
ncbi:MAG TPA: holdfast anchoring protein HfaA [Caulobacteraceae bacterium]|jgi:holdfast attachment protein HfaA